MDLKKSLKNIDSAIATYFFVFIFLMSGVGFLTGIFSLGFLITTITGEWPHILTLFLNGFNIALYVGFGLMALKWIFVLANIIKQKRNKK